jgi:D-aspartate ligase
MGKPSIAVERVRVNPPVKVAPGSPPVIVLNLFHSGLGIARQLAGRGVRVVGLSADPRIYGNFTRFCKTRVAPNSQEEPRQLLRFLLDAAPELHGAVIFPTRDADLLFLDKFRQELETFYTLAIPLPHVLFHIMDKAALARTAAEAGIPVPRTAVGSKLAELQTAAEEFGYPCVLKPVHSVHWRQRNHWKAVGGRKAFRANNPAELQYHHARISQIHGEILLQEWIPGETDQIVVWGGYVRIGEEPLACFTARKLIQCPGEFGTGCVVESDEIPDLLEPSLRLCRALDYEGIAEIEYKRDRRDAKLKLIEINARHWDWHGLGAASDVNLSWAAYCHLTGRPIQSVHTPIQRAKWVAEDAFLTHILASLYNRESKPREAWNAIAGKRTYGIFAWNDPLPFCRYAADVLFPALAGAAVRKISRRVFGAEEHADIRTHGDEN